MTLKRKNLVWIDNKPYIRCKVVMLSTNEKVDIYNHPAPDYKGIGKLYPRKLKEFTIGSYQHIYITSDDEIRENDWMLINKGHFCELQLKKCYRIYKQKDHADQLMIQPNNEQGTGFLYRHEVTKIIAATDKSLEIECDNCKKDEANLELHVYTCSCQLLPQPSQDFINKYIEEYNKGNQIIDVLVEYEQDMNTNHAFMEKYTGAICTKFPNYTKLKVNPKDNIITIKKVKDSWSKLEVCHIVRDVCNVLGVDSGYAVDYIKENL